MAILIVSVEELARRLGLESPPGEEVAWTLERAILDAQADVEAYLGRSLMPETFTESGLVAWPDGWRLQHEPVLEVVSVVPEVWPDDPGLPTGRFTVTYRAGLDALNDPVLEPIRRFVRTHAMYAPEVRALVEAGRPGAVQRAASLTAEAQSVTYEERYPVSLNGPGSGAPGAFPTLKSLDRWRLAGRRVFQRPTNPSEAEPWPYGYRPSPWRPSPWRRW